MHARQPLAPGQPIRMFTVLGARPQFVKAATISRAAAARSDIVEILVHTGQHFDANMSDVFFDEMGIPRPGHILDIHGGGHGEMTGRMMIALETVLQSERPDVVLVYGDTNSTLAGALCAAKLHIPVAHVEAGLRSFDRRMPEEVNRIVVDAVSDLLFAPTRSAVANLAKEGVRGQVLSVGDVNYDATLMVTELALRQSNIVAHLDLVPGEFAVATVHRASAVEDGAALKAVMDYLRREAARRPIVMPVHPRTRKALEQWAISTEGLKVIDPVGPLDMHRLLHDCAAVYTDSGGVQKEAYFHRKPCVTLRDSTEWVETVEAGWNRLWQGPPYRTRHEIGDYGDGHSAAAMLDAVVRYVSPARQSHD
jgi:UDP-GlcNAc3NAcA epimerase